MWKEYCTCGLQPCCVTKGKSYNLTKSQSPNLQNEDNNIFFAKLWWEINKISVYNCLSKQLNIVTDQSLWASPLL